MCVHDPINGRGANQISPSVKCQVRLKHCMQPSPMSNIYFHAHYLRLFHISPRRESGVSMCTTSSGGGGFEAHTPTHAKYSHATLWHPSTHVCTSIKFWLNKQAVLADHALCLWGRNLVCILYDSQVTYRSILNLTFVREEHLPLPLKSGRSRQHVACRSL